MGDEDIIEALAKFISRVIALVMLFFAPIIYAENMHSVGTRNFETRSGLTRLPVRLFYPTNALMKLESFGPFEVNIAKNAPIADGRFPVIFMVHGYGGNSWGHRDLAIKLAAQGFIVAAPHFRKDQARDFDPKLFQKRSEEFAKAVNFVIEHPELAPFIDPSRLGAFGFSLGGYTVLQGAGGEVELARAWNHCQNFDNDPNFCGGRARDLPKARRLGAPKSLDHKLGAIALAAPLGVVFSDLGAIDMPVLLYRAGEDMELCYPYHAEHIHQLLGRDHGYKTFRGVGHYAFLSPFPEAIKDEVGEAAEDPEGFDRVAFLEKVNTEIAAFFVRGLRNSL